MAYFEEDIIWTEEKCIQLIREYKSRKCLWDSNIPRFYKQSARPEEWEAIGRALNLSAHDCKYKMTILLSSFRREKVKFINALKSGNLFVSRWFGFKEFLFLLNRTIDKKAPLSKEIKQALLEQCQSENDKSPSKDISTSTNNETISEKDEDDTPLISFNDRNEIKTEVESDTESELKFFEETFVPTPGPSQDKRETVKTYNVATSTDPVDLEEITAFTDFIKSKMKKYSEKTVIAVEKAVFDVLLKADRNYFEDDNYETSEVDLNTSNRNPPLKRKRNSDVNIFEEKRQVGESSD